jgi:hypothetical protein
VNSDAVTCSATSGAFNDKNVGTGKTVTASGISLSGGSAGNYSVNTTAQTTANITKAAVTPSVTAVDKTYDGKTNATVTCSVQHLGADALGCADAAAFASPNVGPNITVNATNIYLTGGDAGNYDLTTTTATTTANITPATVTAKVTANNKIYDGNNVASIASCTVGPLFGTDSVTCSDSATFASAAVGTWTVTASGITLGGPAAGNYILPVNSATTTASITQKALTATVTASGKVYDATTAATITQCNLSGLAGTDAVTCSATSGAFNDKNVGTGKTVTASGISLSGGSAGNYSVNITAQTTANITKASVTPSVTAANKSYDGTTAATVTCSVPALLTDSLGCADAAVFSSPNVDNGITVTATNIYLTGGDSGNYDLTKTTATTIANITRAIVTAAVTANSKVYDGSNVASIASCSVTPLFGSDAVTCSGSATFAITAAGTWTVNATGITLGGPAVVNYILPVTTATATASITPKALTATVAAQDKIYNATTAATITQCNLSGVVGTDAVTCSATSGVFNDKNVGPAKTVTASGISLSGSAAGNYSVNSTAQTTANITKALATASVTGNNKVYDATTMATVTCSVSHLGDDSLGCADAAAFASPNVGAGIMVTATGLYLTGSDSGNYALTSTTASTTANITPATASVSTGNSSKYFGQGDPSPLTSATLSGFVPSDNVTASFTRETGEGVGAYHITTTLSPAGLLTNYSITNLGATFTILSASTTTTLASSLSGTAPVKVTLTATATNLSSPVPTFGSVTFWEGGNVIGSQPLAGGSASLPAFIPSLGTHVYKAVFTDSTNNFTGSSSSPSATPVVAMQGPSLNNNNYVVAINAPITVTATNSTPVTSAQWVFTGGASPVVASGTQAGNTISGTTSFTNVGIYYITLTSNDGAGGIGVVNSIDVTGTPLLGQVVVYDPTAGFVTGGGWITSAPGSFSSTSGFNPSLTGKATFGFVSKYQKGANVPTGETQFTFQLAGFDFHSTTYQWLVVSGNQAQYKGTGTINGSGAYQFLLTAKDGGNKSPGGFRIKILDANGVNVIYDNMATIAGTSDALSNTQQIGGGSITIH